MSLNTLVDHNPVALVTQSLFKHSTLLTKLSAYFNHLIFKNANRSAQKILFTVGTLAILYKAASLIFTAYHMTKWIPGHIANRKLTTQQKMKQKYGNCYAVVTGCTEGIGLCYALQFAKRNFGVVLVARNKQKLQKRIQYIKNIVPNFRYQIVIGDFSRAQDIKKIVENLIQLTKKIDIGIIVNNAGLTVSKFTNYLDIKPQQLKDILFVNFDATYHINSSLIPILRNRNKRSAILNLSSCTGVLISHGLGTYTGSKKMLDIYSRTMSIQNRDKIDILSVRPFGVITPMMEMKKGIFMISPKDCVVSSFADLGKFDTTWTGFMHKVQAAVVERKSQQQLFKIYDKLFRAVKV